MAIKRVQKMSPTSISIFHINLIHNMAIIFLTEDEEAEWKINSLSSTLNSHLSPEALTSYTFPHLHGILNPSQSHKRPPDDLIFSKNLEL